MKKICDHYSIYFLTLKVSYKYELNKTNKKVDNKFPSMGIRYIMNLKSYPPQISIVKGNPTISSQSSQKNNPNGEK